MKRLFIMPILMAAVFCLTGCELENQKTTESTNNGDKIANQGENLHGNNGNQNSQLKIKNFELTSENPTSNKVITFSFETEGNVESYLIHERKKDDNNLSIIPSVYDERWTTEKPTSYTIKEPSRYGSRVLYLFLKDAKNNICERRSITVSYRNPNPQWTYLGRNFSAGKVVDTSLAVCHGKVYVAFGQSLSGSPSSKGNKYPVVMKYEDETWTTLPAPSTGKTMFTSIAVDENEKVYLAFRSKEASNKLIVKTFENGQWQFLGSSEGISQGSANDITLKLYQQTPYVVCKDFGEDSKIVLFKYNKEDNSWQKIGTTVSPDKASNPDFEISDQGIFVVYSDEGYDIKAATVRYFDKETNCWQNLGKRGISAGQATYTRIALDGSKVAILYRDATIGAGPTVKLFENNQWQQVGEKQYSNGTMASTNGDIIFLDGLIHTFFKESIGAGSLRGSCMKFKNGSWQYVGGQGFSPYAVDYLQACSEDGAIYLIYKDWGNQQAPYTYQTSLVKFY